MKKRIKRGIIIITTFFLMIIIIMFAGLLVTTSRGALLLGSGYSDSEQAYYAAISGVEFVKSMLKSNEYWMSSSLDYGSDEKNIKEKIIKTDTSKFEIFYNESEGWVLGYLDRDEKNKSNYRSKFRIAFGFVERNPSPLEDEEDKFTLKNGNNFKFRDTSGNPDNGLRNFKNPLETKLISCNNIFNKTIENDFSYAFKNNGTSYIPNKKIPIKTCYIVSQGVAGDTVRHVESFLIRNQDYQQDSCTIAKNDINIMLANPRGSFVFNLAKELLELNKKATLRAGRNIAVITPSKGTIHSLRAGDVTGGEIYTTYLQLNNTAIDKTANTTGIINKNIDISNIGKDGAESTLSEIFDNLDYLTAKKDAFNQRGVTPEFNTSPVFAFIKETGGGYKYATLNLEDLGIDESVSSEDKMAILQKGIDTSNVTNISKVPSSLGAGINVSNSSNSLNVKITKPIDFTNGATFVCLEESNNRYVLSGDSNFNVNLEKKGVISSDKSIDIFASLMGEGKVISNQNVTFYGGSVFETERNTGVAIFATENINVYPSQSELNTQQTCNSMIQKAWGIYTKDKAVSSGFIDLGETSNEEIINSFLNTEIKIGKHTRTLETRLKSLLGKNSSKSQVSEIVSQVILQNSIRGEKPVESNERLMLAKNSTLEQMDTPDKFIAIYDTDTDTNIPTSSNINTQNCNLISIRDSNLDTAKAINLWVNKSDGNIKGIAGDETLMDKIIDLTYFNDDYTPIETNGSPEKLCTLSSGTYTFANKLFKSDFKLNSILAQGDNSKLISYTVPDNDLSSFDGKPNHIYLRQDPTNIVFPSRNATLVNGLLFAKNGNVTINASGAALNIRGGIVAYTNDIIVNNAKNITFTYDPDYMPTFRSGVITKNKFTTTFSQ